MPWGTNIPEYPAALAPYPWNFVKNYGYPKHRYVQQAATARYGLFGDTLFQLIYTVYIIT